MAQRTIHYLFGDILAEKVTLKDKNRFLLGSVLPDAYSDAGQRNTSHFTSRLPTDNRVYFDFNEFRNQFGQLMMTDDLYLGYYMHLVEDDFYRQYIRSGDLKNNLPRSKEEVARLHNDYHLLNSYIVQKYNISYTLVLPADFEKEPINRITAFAFDGFLENMKNDFTEKLQGQTHFLTENMLDEFIDKYIGIAEAELKCVMSGTHYLNAEDYAWMRTV